MKKIYRTLLVCIFVATVISGSGQIFSAENYLALEKETEKCLDHMMNDHGASWDMLKTPFEEYFSGAGISDASSPMEKQYQDILIFMEHPGMGFPEFKEIDKVMLTRENLGLTDGAIMLKAQLDCLTDRYLAHQSELDTNSSFYIFGEILEAVRQVPDISPGLLAGTLNLSMDKDDLQKSFYQKAIALMFCFDMTLDYDAGMREIEAMEGRSEAMDWTEEDIPHEIIPITSASGQDAKNQREPLFMVVESMPEFPGGEKAMYNYLQKNLVYPEKARKQRLEGRVFVTFTIEKDGTVSNVKVLRGIGGGCDEEVVRLVEAMPRWTPGSHRGQAVRVQYNLPVSFKL